jgi:hypothetical protein
LIKSVVQEDSLWKRFYIDSPAMRFEILEL